MYIILFIKAEECKRYRNVTGVQTCALPIYPLSPTLGKYWKRAHRIFMDNLKGDEFNAWFKTFTPEGRAPRVGEIWASEGHARTLELIAETNAEAFYHGELAEKIASFSKETGGFLTAEDLANHRAEWVNPVSINYRGYDIWELPPNGQGVVALQAMNILKGFEF